MPIYRQSSSSTTVFEVLDKQMVPLPLTFDSWTKKLPTPESEEAAFRWMDDYISRTQPALTWIVTEQAAGSTGGQTTATMLRMKISSGGREVADLSVPDVCYALAIRNIKSFESTLTTELKSAGVITL